ncbi:hypothetical protein [Gracilimonas sediminicola]|uniref:Uncharacterized protein n=1 Tax=Gracilimonas sediminicola TaxID=2952158 RepID=A0A9X2L0B5_9BACT|nr:hypothetical protein [Gracilimonas sediminicola]MCP9289986.1 hypothetical protein [Gracilimonas sediminicola]
MNPGLLAVSLYKPSDGTTYQIDGANIAPDSPGYLNQGNFLNQARGGERTKNRTVTFEFRHNDGTFHTNLTGDSDFENRSWRMAAAEMDGFILWYETVRVVVTEEKAEVDPESEDAYPYTVRMKFVGANPSIARGTNLLYAYAKTQGFASAWQDSDSDNVADTFALQNGTSPSFTAGVQQVTTGAGADEFKSNDIAFPVEGITITQSLYANTVAATQDNQVVFFLNYSSSSLSTILKSKTVSQRNSNSGDTPSNVYFIRFVLCNSSGSGETSSFSDPAIRLNGSTTYVDY